MTKHYFRTTAARLRSLLDKSAEAMAEYLGCSLAAIKSVECGRLKLSQSLAVRMAHETGVSWRWLLKGDPRAPIVDDAGAPYTWDTFARAQAKKIADLDEGGAAHAAVFATVRVHRIIESAAAIGDGPVAIYKLEAALSALELEFRKDDPALVKRLGAAAAEAAFAGKPIPGTGDEGLMRKCAEFIERDFKLIRRKATRRRPHTGQSSRRRPRKA